MKKNLIFLFVIFLFIGCQKDVVEPIAPEKTNPTEIQSVNRFMICHVKADGSFLAVGIDILDLNTHLSHGDYVPDQDGDGYTAVSACYGSMNDCNDNNVKVFPGAEEICGDGMDNNCDGKIDEGCPKIPSLIQPINNDVMDNGCLDRTDTISWYFVWKELPGAECYQIFVKHIASNIPVINKTISRTKYLYSCLGGYVADVNSKNWYWKVRAKVNGVWTEWSEVRGFDIEPLNTDC